MSNNMSSDSSTSETVSTYLLSRLKELGCDHMFGVPGDFVLTFFKNLENSSVKYVGCCNELNAAYAADAYARLRGIASLATTYGVGELSAINGVAGSFAERLPVVVITGSPSTSKEAKHLPLHHTLGEYSIPRKIYSHVTVDHFHLNQDNKHDAAAEIDRVLLSCLKLSRPVYLSIPQDLVDFPCKHSAEPLRHRLQRTTDMDALAEALEEVVSMINEAEYPIFIADVGLKRAGQQKEFTKLLENSGLPFAVMMMGKTVIDEDHPQFIGLYMGASSREYVKERVESADCVVFLGLVTTDFNTGGFSVNISKAKTIDIGENSVRIRSHSYNDVQMSLFLHHLSGKLKKRNPEDQKIKRASEGCSYRKSMAYEPSAAAPLTVGRFFQRVSQYIPENSVVIAETGVSLFAAAETMMPKNCTFIAQTFYGSIGYTVGATLGAAVAAPDRKVVLFIGDGSLQVTVQDVSTLIRNKLTPSIFVLNNDGYTIERLILDGGFNDIAAWKYHLLPVVFGEKEGFQARTEGELEEALKKSSMNEFNLFEVFTGKMDATPALIKAGKAMANSE
eukprot:TRINITY_DN1073_c0_g1_i3.p1 TRINITY_DN1073_c0_g1~~TRINITY_DN1073_c0_g1_i3.p1  ORF type:complete len:562 (-),score=124.54 TRINITY_DN1073_c0_g1_i3:119-1804(-)